MSGDDSWASIPNSVRTTIENIKEITGNHSNDEIYAMLKECSMDPNETTQKLLLQGTLFSFFSCFYYCFAVLGFYCFALSILVIQPCSVSSLSTLAFWGSWISAHVLCFSLNSS